MAENETRRVRRTPQQLAEAVDEQISKQEAVIAGYEEKKQTVIAEYDQKIEAVRSKIKKLEEKKKAILAPKPARKPRMTKKQKLEAILKQAQKLYQMIVGKRAWGNLVSRCCDFALDEQQCAAYCRERSSNIEVHEDNGADIKAEMRIFPSM